MVGLPDGKFTTPINPIAKAGAQRLGACFFGGKALGVTWNALRPPFGFALFDIGIDPVDKTLTVFLKSFLDAANVNDVTADTEDHFFKPLLPGL
jgi:hypothetical protein